jgi:hypothetical protein
VRSLLLLLIVLSGCTHPPLSPPTYTLIQDAETRWYIPLAAKNSDWLCVETVPREPNFCLRVGQVRLLAVSAHAN